jgi:type VI secretion system secreted protein Hcp
MGEDDLAHLLPTTTQREAKVMTKQKSSFRAARLAMLGAALLHASGAVASLDQFLKIPGLNGDSRDAIHANEIDVVSSSIVLTKRTCPKVVINKFIDSASPGLAALTVSGTRIPTARLSVRKAGGTPHDYLLADFTNAVVGSMSVDENDTASNEQVILFPQTLTLTYTPQNADGTSGAPIVSTVTCQ